MEPPCLLQEAVKFREDILKSQGEDENSAKIADICTEVLSVPPEGTAGHA